MPTKDGFDPDNFSHCFLADEPFLLANEPERQGIADEADQQLLLKVSILAAIAAAISIAISLVGNLGTPFADVTASVADKSAKDPPNRDELAAASEPAGRNQPESSAPSSEALFREFQAWAAEKDAQAQVQPVQQPVQDAAAKTTGNARASLRLAQKQPHVRPVHNARAQDPFLRILGLRN
jgi:hypothetical protein